MPQIKKSIANARNIKAQKCLVGYQFRMLNSSSKHLVHGNIRLIDESLARQLAYHVHI
jgi:hypothetical protein